ncbi:MAG: 3-keto-5-aminohexanoate cleavage protein, partial [Pseudomonadota bacterium]|nr:3-keto-5-aminohexanoate cleavage protein [Pseudomonadota bacterium]
NESLAKAAEMGGKLRVGFENSLYMPDGTVAPHNAARVAAANALFN